MDGIFLVHAGDHLFDVLQISPTVVGSLVAPPSPSKPDRNSACGKNHASASRLIDAARVDGNVPPHRVKVGCAKKVALQARDFVGGVPVHVL